ncbi:hypothetical protein MKZ38_007353 [Zalerion maritima]|uniref:Transmembrane adaptor Erv26 n=1 Tax=Zalerion maritima TaxID=339359 RepID=A0AAD5RUW8_9PEZI|nr:hypothetical protein MKZ38_007353 [Zalerion maritima]
MWILPLIGYLGTVLGFCFLTLSIASGLYYLSELVEEHTVIAKRLLIRLIYLSIGLQTVMALVDRLPVTPTVFGVVAHVVYLGNMSRFPFVKLTDPLFLLSGVMVLGHHYLWFRFFSQAQGRAYANMTNIYDPIDAPTFSQVASYFGLCVWLVPFALFVSLSAGDNVLPTMDSETPVHGSKRQGMIKTIVDSTLGGIGEVTKMFGPISPKCHEMCRTDHLVIIITDPAFSTAQAGRFRDILAEEKPASALRSYTGSRPEFQEVGGFTPYFFFDPMVAVMSLFAKIVFDGLYTRHETILINFLMQQLPHPFTSLIRDIGEKG